MTKIRDSVVWVTGASSGIGEAMVYQLAEKGARLIISARREGELDRVKERCKSEFVKILPLDLAAGPTLAQKVNEAIAGYGHVDVLINNGGVSQRDLIINTDLEVDRKIMEVNYFGTIALSKYILPHMIERRFGHHVVITSAAGIINTPYRSGYGASKHALHGFYDVLRAEHHSDGIRVTIVAPGFVKTNISFNALTGDGTTQNKMDNAQNKGLSPESCASSIIRAIEQNKQQLYVGGAKEKFGIYLKRFWPWAASIGVRKLKVV